MTKILTSKLVVDFPFFLLESILCDWDQQYSSLKKQKYLNARE